MHQTTRAGTTRADLLSVAAAGVLWGTGGLAGALLDRTAGLSPLTVAAYRLLVGGLLLVGLLVATGAVRGMRRDGVTLRMLAGIGLLAGLYHACYFAAVSLTTVSLAALVTLGTSPMLVVAADAALERRPPSRRVVTAIAVAVAGLLLLVGVPGDGQDPATLLTGCALAVCSAAGFAAITLLGRRPVAGLGPATTTGFAFASVGWCYSSWPRRPVSRSRRRHRRSSSSRTSKLRPPPSRTSCTSEGCARCSRDLPR